MGVWWGVEDYYVDVWVGDEIFGSGVVFEVRVVFWGGVVWFGSVLDDRVKFEGGGELDERDVEDFGGEVGGGG